MPRAWLMPPRSLDVRLLLLCRQLHLLSRSTAQRATALTWFCMATFMMTRVPTHCELAEEEGYTFVHPFDDLDVATGQGTIAMEIVQELPTVDYILVPIGGGGLVTGVSTLAKMLNPKIQVIGVEPAAAASMTAALKNGRSGNPGQR